MAKKSPDRQKYIERRTEYYKIKKESAENARKKAEKDAEKIKWKSLIFTLLFIALFLAGCAGLDSFVGYNPTTDTVTPGAPLDTVKDVSGAFGPYGQVAAIVLGTLGAGYVAFRKIQQKLKK